MQVPDRRQAVAELTKEGLSIRQIAEVTGVSKTVVADDSVRNRTPATDGTVSSAASEDDPVRNRTPDLEAEAKTKTRKQRDLKAAARHIYGAIPGGSRAVPEGC